MVDAQTKDGDATREIMISPRANVSAQLTVPEDAHAVVVVAQAGAPDLAALGADALARALRQNGKVATVVLDLVAEGEITGDEKERESLLEHAIPRLAERMSGAADFAGADAATKHLPIAFVATGAAAAAALLASTTRPSVRAIVAIDGRPDLAGDALETLTAPALFVVDERDDALLARNRSARGRLRGKNELAVLPGGPPSSGNGGRAQSEILRRTWTWLERYLG